MARSRSLPVNLFEEPAFFELDGEIQSVLIGLVLAADDHGRGLAHTGLLARKFNKSEPHIDCALHALQACGLVVCYQDERQHYYALVRWLEWEKLHKPARSKYPAPPFPPEPDETFHSSPYIPEKNVENSGEMRKPILEGEGEEEEEREEEGEGELSSQNISVLPPLTRTHTTSGSGDLVSLEEDTLTRQVASILKMKPDESLRRLLAEYRDKPFISLTGEADAAREWIDDPRRNYQRRPMNVHFFRRWLRREYEDHEHRQRQRQTQNQSSLPEKQVSVSGGGLASQSLMDLEATYKAARTRKGGSLR